MPSFSAFSLELCKLAEKGPTPKTKIPVLKSNEQIFRELSKGSPVAIKITDEAHKYGGGFYDPEAKVIGLTDRNFATLAHELGHAEIDKHFLGRVLQGRIPQGAYNHILLGGLGGAVLKANGKKWGALLPVALAAPKLLAEALASIKGRKKLNEVGASSSQKEEYSREMTAHGGSYAVLPAALAGLIGLRPGPK